MVTPRSIRGLRALIPLLASVLVLGGCDKPSPSESSGEGARLARGVILAGGDQTGEAGRALPLTISVAARTKAGVGIPGVPLQVTGPGQVEPHIATDSQGVARFVWVLPGEEGAHELSVSGLIFPRVDGHRDKGPG